MTIRAIDTETTHAGTVSEPIPTLCSVAWWDDTEGSIVQPAHRVDWDRVVQTYRDGAVLAGSAFDAYVFRKARPEIWPEIMDAYDAGRVYDINTREKMIAAATGRKVHRVNAGSVCAQYGIEIDKTDPVRTRFREVLGLELDQWHPAFRAYAARDPWAEFRAYKMQEETAPAGTFGTAIVNAWMQLALYDQTVWGVRCDTARADALDRTLAERMDAIAWELLPSGLMYFKGVRKPEFKRSQKRAQEVIADHCEATPGAKLVPTAKGPSLSADSLRLACLPQTSAKQWLEPKPPQAYAHLLRKYALWGSLSSLRSKNIPSFKRAVIRTRYDEFKVTARTGSSNPNRKKASECGPDEWTGSNLQNLARPDTLAGLGFDEGEGFRELLIPYDGYGFIISDWSGAELVTLAQTLLRLFGWSNLADILRQGRDLHGEMAARILGIDYATFDKSILEHKQARQLAKACDFGFPGGLGIDRFVDFALNQYGIEISKSEARRLKRIWMELLPEMQLYFEYINTLQIAPKTFRVTVPGVPLTRVCGYNDACNLGFQGPAALAAKIAGWELYKAGQNPASPLYGTRQVLFVHDEWVSESPLDRIEQARLEQRRIMIGAFGQVCPDVPISVEDHISTCYDK